MVRSTIFGWLVISLLLAGCHAGGNPRRVQVSENQPPKLALRRANSLPILIKQQVQPEILPVSHSQNSNPIVPEVIAEVAPQPIQGELSLTELIANVESRNPSLQAMQAAWQAAAQRYPQVVALDDPMLMAMSAPGSIHSSQVENAYVLQVGQKLPWYGKRSDRGLIASNEADAAFHEVGDSRLQIALVVQTAYYEYYLAHKLLALNTDNRQLLESFRETAQAKYRTNQVTQQDVLQADVELAELERRRLELDRMKKISIARINTLLLQPPTNHLPSPTQQLPPAPPSVPPEQLLALAVSSRPDLAALAHRVQSDEAALSLAYRQFYPDAEFFGRSDSFWQPAATQSPLRGQVGVNFNMPIYRKKLNAAVCEAQFRLQKRRAEYQQRLAEIDYEVQSAWEQAEESRKSLALYENSLASIAQQNVAAARVNYEVGKMSFLELAQTMRQQIQVREKQQESLVAYHRRLAELTRVVGQAAVQSTTISE